MSVHRLTALQYSEDREGPFRLYIYRADGYHDGGKWFRPGKLKYPEEELTVKEANDLSNKAIAAGNEVRITDGGDMLVFHSKDKKLQYGEGFWGALFEKENPE